MSVAGQRSEDEESVRKTATLSLLILVSFTLLACREGRSAASSSSRGVATDTIAPAAAQPAPNGNDAMTQTVDVEDGRSESDGGVITNPPSTARGAAPPAAKTSAHPVKKKKP